jgi:type I restriction enzyme S subunit
MTLQEVKLEDIVKFSNGKSPNPSDHGAYLIFGSNGIIGKSENFNYENGVIIGRVGAYCGSVQVCDNKFWASDNTIVAKPIDNNNLNYIYYLLTGLKRSLS